MGRLGFNYFEERRYLIKTNLDVAIDRIFKGDVIDGFAPAIHLIKPSQSAVTIDGSKTLVVYINIISMSFCLFVCLFVLKLLLGKLLSIDE